MVRTTRRHASSRKKVLLLAAALASLAAFKKREKLKKAVALALGYHPSPPPPPPPTPPLPPPQPLTPLEIMYRNLRLMSLEEPSGPKRVNLESEISKFLETREKEELVRSFQTFKVTRAEYDNFKASDECTLDPERELMLKQLVNDKRLVDYYADPVKLNLPFEFVALILHGSMITYETNDGVEFETYTVPPGCSVTIVYLTTPGILHVDNALTISKEVFENFEYIMKKHPDLSSLELTRIISFIGKDYHDSLKLTRQQLAETEKNNPESVERVVKYSECVTLTYFEGESFLNKSFSADATEASFKKYRPKNQHCYNIALTQKNNGTINGPFFKADNLDGIKSVKTSELLTDFVFDDGKQKNVVIVDGSCSFIRHGLSPEATIDDNPLFSENYIKYFIHKCTKHNVAGGSN